MEVAAVRSQELVPIGWYEPFVRFSYKQKLKIAAIRIESPMNFWQREIAHALQVFFRHHGVNFTHWYVGQTACVNLFSELRIKNLLFFFIFKFTSEKLLLLFFCCQEKLNFSNYFSGDRHKDPFPIAACDFRDLAVNNFIFVVVEQGMEIVRFQMLITHRWTIGSKRFVARLYDVRLPLRLYFGNVAWSSVN